MFVYLSTYGESVIGRMVIITIAHKRHALLHTAIGTSHMIRDAHNFLAGSLKANER